jgi:hypothetical protein
MNAALNYSLVISFYGLTYSTLSALSVFEKESKRCSTRGGTLDELR